MLYEAQAEEKIKRKRLLEKERKLLLRFEEQEMTTNISIEYF